MPRKGTKKIKAHTRSPTLFTAGGLKFKDPTRTITVKEHYRGKKKRVK